VKDLIAFRYCSAVALLAGSILAAADSPLRAAPTPADHTVGWYVANPLVRQSVLQRCDNDRSLDGNGDCRNATAAAAKAAPDGNLNGQDAFAAENSVTPYLANGALRGMVLGACATNQPPPVSWCKAAKEAQSELSK
jgi:hypothetical protein